jgi:hypothetical protein
MLLVTLLCYVGFAALSLSMPRHYADLAGGTLSTARGRSLKVLGGCALLVSLIVALRLQSTGFALVHWFAALMGSAVSLVFLMSYWPRQALWLAGIVAFVSPIVAFIQLLV